MSWKRLGRRFEASMRLFEVVGGALRPLGGVWQPLEASWTAVGRLLALGNDCCWFWIDFWKILGCFLESKIDPKSIIFWTYFWIRFFDWFLIGFCSQHVPIEIDFSSPHCRESTIYQKIDFRNWHRFLIDLGANLAPFSFPISIKIASKSDFKWHRFFDRF